MEYKVKLKPQLLRKWPGDGLISKRSETQNSVKCAESYCNLLLYVPFVQAVQ